MGYRLEKTKLCHRWYEALTVKIQAQVESRLLKITTDEHFGHVRQLDKSLAEIKFNNGNRIYFTVKRDGEKTIILLLGGNKNGQDKDIKKAKSLLD